MSDNGSQFTSSQFQDFCQRWGIQHIRSPPYHPQSNGQAERFVDTFKRALAKSKGEGTMEEILETFLLTYRTTPNNARSDHLTPAEALMRRRIRTKFDLLRPSDVYSKQPQDPRKHYFQPGEMVHVRDYRKDHPPWIDGVIKQRNGKVLYKVLVEGDIWTRHYNQLRPRRSTSIIPVSRMPLEILIDTFGIPSASISCRDTEHAVSHTQPHRHSKRLRRPVISLKVDP